MIKERLRRWPPLYDFLKRAFYTGWYWSERLFGTRLHELLWRMRRFEDSAHQLEQADVRVANR